MFLVNVPKIFKIAMRAYSETISKVTCKISGFCNFVENYHSIIGMFQKVFLPEISKNPLLTRGTSL